MIANIIRGGHESSPAFFCGHPGTVDPSAESRGIHAVNPAENECQLFGQQAAALLLVEKNDSAGWEAFSLCRFHGRMRILRAESVGVSSAPKLPVETAIEEQ